MPTTTPSSTCQRSSPSTTAPTRSTPHFTYLTPLRETVLPVPEEIYLDQKAEALARVERRDLDDWPILAAALVFECPIGTEDSDFFGTGVPTWTTDRVELYLKPDA